MQERIKRARKVLKKIREYNELMSDATKMAEYAEEVCGVRFQETFGAIRGDGIGSDPKTLISVLYTYLCKFKGDLEDEKLDILSGAVGVQLPEFTTLRKTKMKAPSDNNIKHFLMTANAMLRMKHVQKIQKKISYDECCEEYTESVLRDVLNFNEFESNVFKEKCKDIKIQLNEYLGQKASRSRLPVYIWLWSRKGGTYKTATMSHLFDIFDFMATNGAKPEELSDGGKNRNFVDVERYLVQVFNDPNEGTGSISSNTFKALVDPEATGRPMGTNGTVKVYNRSLYIFTANTPREEYTAFSDDGDLRRCMQIECDFNITKYKDLEQIDPWKFFQGINEDRIYIGFEEFRTEYADARSHLIKKHSIDAFLEEEFVIPIGEKLEGVRTKTIYRSYRNFCQENGYKPKNKSNFVTDLKTHGLQEVPLISDMKQVKGFYINEDSPLVLKDKIKLSKLGG